MMKNKIIFSGMLVATLLVVTACSQSAETSTSVTTTSGEEDAKTTTQERQDAPDITGVITSITANEITVAEIEMPEGGRAGMRGEENPDSSEEDSEAKALTFGATGSAEAGGQGGGGREGGQGGPPDGEQGGERGGSTDMIDTLIENSTSKVKVTVPVGIAMTMMDESRNAIEASLADLEAKQMVSIWLNDAIEDRSVAEYLTIK